jgi:hypothetical protein
LKKELSRFHAVEEHDRKILRQDLQDEQDELWRAERSPNDEGLFLRPHPPFRPVNPVNPVKIQFFNDIVPAWSRSIASDKTHKDGESQIPPHKITAFRMQNPSAQKMLVILHLQSQRTVL